MASILAVAVMTMKTATVMATTQLQPRASSRCAGGSLHALRGICGAAPRADNLSRLLLTWITCYTAILLGAGQHARLLPWNPSRPTPRASISPTAFT